MACISVGHRPTLKNYHENVLEITENKGWRLLPAASYQFTENQFISMNSNTEKAQESESTEPEKTDSEIKNLSPSATTNDIPEFGWSGYAERINGRFAMIGLIAVLLVEALSKISFLEWAGIISQ